MRTTTGERRHGTRGGVTKGGNVLRRIESVERRVTVGFPREVSQSLVVRACGSLARVMVFDEFLGHRFAREKDAPRYLVGGRTRLFVDRRAISQITRENFQNASVRSCKPNTYQIVWIKYGIFPHLKTSLPSLVRCGCHGLGASALYERAAAFPPEPGNQGLIRLGLKSRRRRRSALSLLPTLTRSPLETPQTTARVSHAATKIEPRA